MDFLRHDAPLFDLQVNGFAGIDFQSPCLTPFELEFACERLRRRRVGGILLTLITAPLPQLCRQLEKIEAWRQASPLIAETIAGYHLEGPFISDQPGYCGAHPANETADPTPRAVSRLVEAAGGQLRLMTLAPERQGAAAAIRDLVDMNVVVSLGHTDASNADIDQAIEAGATLCTHLGNGAPLNLPRHDNIIQRLLSRDELIACFIPDGIHIPFPVLKNFLRAKPPEQVIFTTDCMAAAGASPGDYTLGKLRVHVGADGVARQPDGGGLAGSSLCPDEAVDNLTRHLGYTHAAATSALGSRVREALGISAPILAKPPQTARPTEN
jgi:N-acetylglucosamine-6-phosphate deacetylase